MKEYPIIKPEPPSLQVIREGDDPRSSEYNNFNNDNIKAIIVGIVAGIACIGLGVLLGNFIQTIL